MEFYGIVKNGMVFLPDGHPFPEGARVFIRLLDSGRVKLPLVPSDNPGSIKLTNAMIAEIFDEEDAARYEKE